MRKLKEISTAYRPELYALGIWGFIFLVVGLIILWKPYIEPLLQSLFP